MEIEEHPRIKEKRENENKYKHRLVIEGNLYSPENLLKLAFFQTDRTVLIWSTFKINKKKHIIYYSRHEDGKFPH